MGGMISVNGDHFILVEHEKSYQNPSTVKFVQPMEFLNSCSTDFTGSDLPLGTKIRLRSMLNRAILEEQQENVRKSKEQHE
jgi:hypothetical protein